MYTSIINKLPQPGQFYGQFQTGAANRVKGTKAEEVLNFLNEKAGHNYRPVKEYCGGENVRENI